MLHFCSRTYGGPADILMCLSVCAISAPFKIVGLAPPPQVAQGGTFYFDASARERLAESTAASEPKAELWLKTGIRKRGPDKYLSEDTKKQQAEVDLAILGMYTTLFLVICVSVGTFCKDVFSKVDSPSIVPISSIT